MKERLLLIILLIIILFNCKILKEPMIKLNNKEAILLKINEEASYDFQLHESVGFTAEYSISDENILKCIDTKVKYHHPEKMKQGMTGSDEATGTFIFKALKKGNIELTIKHLFRGNLEKEVKIKITVN